MTRSGTSRPPRVGLVLGGGGMPGIAFHAGTLLALEHDLGWDPRSADVVVGTSAGSIVGALLRAGLSTDDLAAWSTGAAPGEGREHLRAAIERVGDAGLRVVGPRPSVTAASITGLAVSALNFGVLDGRRAMAELADVLDEWSAEPLLVTAVRATDAHLVVFDRSSGVPIRDAVAASCAIPGIFRPVRIDGVAHVDGGVRSATNAELLVDAGVDVAVVIAPMSGDAPHPRWRLDRALAPPAALRSFARRQLRGEVRTLEAAGIATVVFRPDADTARAAGWNALGRGRTLDVAQHAFLGALAAHGSRDDPDGRAAIDALQALVGDRAHGFRRAGYPHGMHVAAAIEPAGSPGVG